MLLCACVLQQKQQSPGLDQDTVTNGQLKQMCDNVLQLLTNTVEHTESVMSCHILCDFYSV